MYLCPGLNSLFIDQPCHLWHTYIGLSRPQRKESGDKHFFLPSFPHYVGKLLAFSYFMKWSWSFLLRLGGAVFCYSNCACVLLLTG